MVEQYGKCLFYTIAGRPNEVALKFRGSTQVYFMVKECLWSITSTATSEVQIISTIFCKRNVVI
jgi:hypothetical protein